MGLIRKSDPIADASAVVARLEVQRARLSDRLAGAVAAVEASQRARREALVEGDPDIKAMAALDLACSRAAEARSGVEEAARAVAQQIEEATRTRDALTDAALRSELAADAERRADALDAAASVLAKAARAFDAARAAMVTAVAEHGAAIDNPLSTDGSTPAATMARPITAAAIRMAAPTFGPTHDGLGAAYDSDPQLVMRRSQSGRLRDHAEDLRTGKTPAAELRRPTNVSAVDPNNPLTTQVEKTRGVFREPFCFVGQAGRMVHGDAGDAEVPVAVLEAAKDIGIAVDRGTPEAEAILRELRKPPVPGYLKTPGRPATPIARFIDLAAA